MRGKEGDTAEVNEEEGKESETEVSEWRRRRQMKRHRYGEK